MPNEKADIWMPVYIGDYLADTSRLTTEQHGAYFLLLMDYWKNGPLPNDDRVLAQITRLTFDAWSMHQAMLKQFFSIGEDGLLHQKRSDEEIAEARKNKEEAVKKAKKAANKRWGNGDHAPSNAPSIPTSNTQAVLEQCPSPSPLPLNAVSDANASSPRRDADGDSDPDEFIYSQYPRKEGHGAAITSIAKAVKRLGKGEGGMPPMQTREARVFLYRRVQTYARSPAGKNPDQTKIPHPTTWFNQSRYLDDEKHWHQVAGDFDGKHIGNNAGAVGRVERTRSNFRKAAERRGVGSVDGLAGSAGGPLSAPGVPGGDDGHLAGSDRDAGAEVYAPTDAAGFGGFPDSSGPEILPPSLGNRGSTGGFDG